MDTLFGIAGKDFALLVSDRSEATSIFRLKDDVTKIVNLDDTKILGLNGEQCHRVEFGELMIRNLDLFKFRTGTTLSTKTTANWIRSQVADALRRAPYQVNCLIAGYDKEEGASMYYLDYLGSMHQVAKGGHGYGNYFMGGLLDEKWYPDMTLEEAIEACKDCLTALSKRFLIKQPVFMAKVVDKDGIREIDISQ